MIHVCFGLHDATGRYSKFTGTAMASMFENSYPPKKTITVHILHDNTLTADNRDKFVYLAGQYGQRVKFYNVETLCADKVDELKNSYMKRSMERYSVGAIFRFLIPYVLPSDIKKIIYLDSDIIVNLDVAELWRIELDDAPLAAVPEVLNYVPTDTLHYLCRERIVKADDYFNTGMLLLNLESLKKQIDLIRRGINFYGKHLECDCLDQDVLNYCFATQTVKLPQKFNVLVEYARPNNDLETANRICHYITSSRGKGFGLNTNDPFNRLWLSYFVRTPFFDADSIGRLYEGFRQMHVGLKNSMAQLSAMMSGKTRGFFVMPANVDAFRKIFYIRPDEEIIAAENQASLKKLLDAMNVSRGKKIFFICVSNFPFGALIQAGFVAGIDFINGMDFLSEAHGVPLNPYRFIKVM